ACSFDDLGVSTDSFLLYLQNDSVSQEALASTIASSTYPEIEKFEVQFHGYPIGANVNIVQELSGAGGGRRILFPSQITGCGEYRVKINGGTERVGETVQEGRATILVTLEQGRSAGQQCDSQIQNVLNFLPKDARWSVMDSKGSWLTTVNAADAALNEVAKKWPEQRSSEKKTARLREAETRYC
ncbi:MAG: hypothetical protein V1847_01810, partial [Candidatus Diapherotrites archaeon]